jgi:hypothetical protein
MNTAKRMKTPMEISEIHFAYLQKECTLNHFIVLLKQFQKHENSISYEKMTKNIKKLKDSFDVTEESIEK